MVQANGMTVQMEGTYDELMEELAQIVASYVRTKELDEDDILLAIKEGIKGGLEE